MKKCSLIFIASFLFSTMAGCATDDSLDEIESHNDSIEAQKLFSYDAEIYSIIPNLGSFNNHSFQGFAIYGDIAFGFYDTGLCRTIDLEQKKILAEFTLPEGVNHKYNHAGVACFSNVFFSDKDKFPLLYLSSYQERKCYVLNMTTTNAKLIQTIITVDSLNKNVIQDVLAYEPDGELLLLKMSSPNEGGKIGYDWVSIKMPPVIEGSNINLDINNKFDDFVTFSTAKYNAGFALNGRLYQLAGYTKSSRKLYILDYINKRTIIDVLWNNPIIDDQEQEQCSKYKDGIIINYNNSDKLVYVRFKNWSF